MHTSAAVRFGAPALLLIYGVLRLVDGSDGHHDKDGPLWNVGHVCFFIAFVLLGMLTWGLRGAAATRWPVLSGVAAAAGLVGVACFLWVITGDLLPSFPELPDPLQVAGPALFQLGVLTLLTLLVVDRRLPVWSPVLIVLAFATIGVNLDFIPLAAVLLLAGLYPLAARPLRT